MTTIVSSVACFGRHVSSFTNTRSLHTLPFYWLLTKSYNGTIFHSFLQEVKHIGSSHNRSALPFTGFGPKVLTNQYNNPAGLYSSENIKDFNSAVDEVKTMAAANNEDSAK